LGEILQELLLNQLFNEESATRLSEAIEFKFANEVRVSKKEGVFII
jgi:hypothetical protein